MNNSFFSEIGWIPESAELVPLGELLETVIDHRGKTPKKLGGDWVEVGIPAISAKNVHNGVLTNKDDIRCVSKSIYKKWMKEDVKRGDILLASEGATMGEYLYWDYDYPIVLSQRLFCLRADNKRLNSKYLYAFIRSESFQKQLSGRATGTSVFGVRQSTLLEILVPIIDYKSQEFIGNTIYQLEKKIDLNCQMNQTLEAMAQALFKSWFVDFDPVIDNAIQAGNEIPEELQARAEKRRVIAGSVIASGAKQSNQALKPLLHTNPSLAAQFPASFVFNETLGKWIPEGWEVKSLDEIANYQNGLALQKFRPSNDEEEFLPVLKISHLKEGKTDGKERSRVDIKPECIVDNGDIIFSWSASLMVEIWCGGKAALNQHLFKVTSDKYPKWFYFLFTRYHLDEFIRIASDKAVTMGHIKREHLSDAKCAFMKKSMLDMISPDFENLLEKQISLKLEIETLTQLRNRLLPELISGRVRVKE